MKDDTELEDTILGTALARAIESQSPRETPFAASRVATGAPPRARAFAWPALGIAAAIVLGLAVGAALLGQRRTDGYPVATQPLPTAPAARTAEPSASAVAIPAVPMVVYFARPGLPPVAGTALGSQGGPANDKAEGRISSRIGALWGAHDIPAGARNLLTLPPGTTSGSRRDAIKVDGDTATVDLVVDPPLAVASVADAQGLVQQLVYTITEEPGIQRVVLLSGGKPMVLGSYPVGSQPLARSDVAGYTVQGLTGTFRLDGSSAPSQLTTSYAVDTVAPALARFTIAVSGLPAHTAPSFTVTAHDQTHMSGANAELEITIPNGADTTTAAAPVDRPPLRSIAIGSPVTFRAKVYRLGLDHLWPWRAVVLYDPTRIVIDIGGPPSAISSDQNMAVYAPAPNAEVGHTLTISGAARAYEATVSYRVRDDHMNVVLYGYAKATIGTSSVWGGYDASMTLPASVAGAVLLEVFEVSPKDGTEVSTVTVPLRVR